MSVSYIVSEVYWDIALKVRTAKFSYLTCISAFSTPSNEAKYQQASSRTDDTASDGCRSWTSFLDSRQNSNRCAARAHVSEDRLEALVMLYGGRVPARTVIGLRDSTVCP